MDDRNLNIFEKAIKIILITITILIMLVLANPMFEMTLQ